jgi:DNA repair protein RadC
MSEYLIDDDYDDLTENPSTSLLDHLLSAYIRPDSHAEVVLDPEDLEEALEDIEEEILTPNRGPRGINPEQLIRQLVSEYPALRTIARKLEKSRGKVALQSKELLQLIQVVSAVEKAKKRREDPHPMIHGVLDVAKVMSPLLVDLSKEQSWLMVIDGKEGGRLLYKAKMAQGTKNHVNNDIHKIIRTTKQYGKSFIRVHNHPSGFGYASDADLRSSLIIGKMVLQHGLYQMDSIVVARGGFNSCRTILVKAHGLEWPGARTARPRRPLQARPPQRTRRTRRPRRPRRIRY